MTSGPVEPNAALIAAARDVTNLWLGRLAASVAGPATDAAIDAAIASVAADVDRSLNDLLATDVERQTSTPLTIFRDASMKLSAVLVDRGFPPSGRPPTRDQFHAAQFPDDVYGFVPATWSDIDEAMVDPGLAWGAWKAMTILARRRATDEHDRRDAGMD